MDVTLSQMVGRPRQCLCQLVTIQALKTIRQTMIPTTKPSSLTRDGHISSSTKRVGSIKKIRKKRVKKSDLQWLVPSLKIWGSNYTGVKFFLLSGVNGWACQDSSYVHWWLLRPLKGLEKPMVPSTKSHSLTRDGHIFSFFFHLHRMWVVLKNRQGSKTKKKWLGVISFIPQEYEFKFHRYQPLLSDVSGKKTYLDTVGGGMQRWGGGSSAIHTPFHTLILLLLNNLQVLFRWEELSLSNKIT